MKNIDKISMEGLMRMTNGLTLHSPTIRLNGNLELIDDHIWIIIPIRLGTYQYYWNYRCNKFGKNGQQKEASHQPKWENFDSIKT